MTIGQLYNLAYWQLVT